MWFPKLEVNTSNLRVNTYLSTCLCHRFGSFSGYSSEKLTANIILSAKPPTLWAHKHSCEDASTHTCLISPKIVPSLNGPHNQTPYQSSFQKNDIFSEIQEPKKTRKWGLAWKIPKISFKTTLSLHRLMNRYSDVSHHYQRSICI